MSESQELWMAAAALMISCWRDGSGVAAWNGGSFAAWNSVTAWNVRCGAGGWHARREGVGGTEGGGRRQCHVERRKYHSGSRRPWIGDGTASNKPLGQQSGERPSRDGGPDRFVMATCPWTLSQRLGTFVELGI